jgi:hypothetical protein
VTRIPLDVVEKLFGRELSMGKSLGLTGMLKATQREARERLATGARSPATEPAGS